MQTIPAEVLTLLKSRKQIGADRPAYEVTIAGAPLGAVTELASDDQTLQGIGGVTKYISNWVPMTSGGYMCCWFDAATKELQTGFSADDAFLTTDYAMDSVTATAAITVGYVSSYQTALYRRSDGKVLLFVTNSVAGASWLKVFISDGGNGDDWAYYSTVVAAVNATLVNNQQCVAEPIITPTGRLVLVFTSPKDKFTGVWGIWCIATSDDAGLTWTIRKEESYSYSNYSGQPIILPDGSLFAQYTGSNGVCRLYRSTDDGSSWGDTLISWYDDGQCWTYFMHGTTAYAMASNNMLYSLSNPTADNFTNLDNWTLIWGNTDGTSNMPPRVYLVGNKMAVYGDQDDANSWILYGDLPSLSKEIPVKSITIDRSRGAAAAQATIVLDNKGGRYSPDGTGEWTGVIMPNVEVTVKQGYGADLVQTFTGYIDSVEMTNFPAELRISCRDKGKLALDRIITNAEDGGHYKKYLNKTVEYIVGDLASLCGLTTGTIEATGMTLTSKQFSWESYADAIDWLADISSSSWRVDEFGVLHFTRDVMPVSPTTAYSFAEGEDIISLGYVISDEQLYYTATVYGVDANDAVIKASANFGAPLTYGLFSQKVLKIDASDADTLAKCQEIADRAVALMLCRCRVVDFAAIAVPWVQVGDFIQVVETTTTISELYRVTDISLNQDSSGFTMGIKCYWYGEVPT